jgi:integral membrane sensor domain MASE1
MPSDRTRISERALVLLGAIAGVVFVAAVIEAAFAPSWVGTAISSAVALLALALLSLSVRNSQWKCPGASANTQLQQSPPAIIEPERGDA